MTKPFNVRITCENCGYQTTAETAFGRWMRNEPDLCSSKGIIRTDTDHTILRYKTAAEGKEYQLIIDLEVKEFLSQPDPAQKTILLFKHQLANITGRNMYGAVTRMTRKLKSFIMGRRVNVRYLGYHLLQFEKTNPKDSTLILWDHKPVDCETLKKLLLIEIDPYTFRPMEHLLRDRHARDDESWLFEIDHIRPPK